MRYVPTPAPVSTACKSFCGRKLRDLPSLPPSVVAKEGPLNGGWRVTGEGSPSPGPNTDPASPYPRSPFLHSKATLMVCHAAPFSLISRVSAIAAVSKFETSCCEVYRHESLRPQLCYNIINLEDVESLLYLTFETKALVERLTVQLFKFLDQGEPTVNDMSSNMMHRLLKTCHVGTKCCLSTLIWSLATWIVIFQVYHVLYPSKSEIPEPQKSQLMDSMDVSPDISAFQSALQHVSIRGEPSMKESSSVQVRENSSLKNNTRNRAVEEAKLLHLKKLAGILFPSKELSMDASKANHSEVGIYHPGREWRDIAGHPIQAHGGGIIYVPEIETFYWYGENKGGRTYRLSKRGTARVDVLGINCYSSKDLWSWKFEGPALKGEYRNKKSDLYVKNVVERPKVIYNDRSKLYVMWMHIDNGTYSKAAVGVAVSTHPVGPFEYLGSKRPHGCDSRDMTVFKDDNGDAYIVYSSQINNELHVGKLTEDYLDVMERGMEKIFIKQRREAPAVFKHKSVYYMLTSGCSSWNPNGALIHASSSMLGPWVTIGDPCVGGYEEIRTLTFFSQGAFVLPLPGLQDTFIFMGDRWLPSDLRDSRYVWLPLTMNGPLGQGLSTDIVFPQLQRVSIRWADEWKLPQGWNNSQNL